MRLIRLKAGFLALCLAAVTCCNTALAQVTYKLNRVPLFNVNASDYNSTGLNNLGLAIGFHELGGITHGFVYDHYGLLGLPKTTHTLTDLIDFPDGWNSKCGGLNDMGQVVGAFERTTALGTEREGFLLDLDIFSPTPTPSWRFLPKPAGAISGYGRKINNDGLVLIEALQSENTQGVYTEQYVYDSRVPVDELVPLLVPRTVRFMDINDSRQFAGSTGVRLTLTPELGIQEMLTVPGVVLSPSINTHGMLGLQLKETRDSRGRIITPNLAARYSDTEGVKKLSTIHSGVWDINDSGDVCGFNGTTNSPAIYRENGWLYLKDLVTGTPDDVGMWLAAGERKVKYIANRDATGFGNLYAIAVRATKIGKNTAYDVRHFLLEPKLP